MFSCGYIVYDWEVLISEKTRPYLDYTKIGAEQRDTLGGAYTAHGFVKRREEAPVQAEAPKAMLLTLTASEQSYLLVLPASEKQLEHAKKSLGIEEFAQAVIANAEYTAPYLNQLIPMDGITAEDANEMRVLFSQAVEDGDKYRLIFGYTEDVGRFNYGFVHGSKTKIGNLIVGWNEASQTIECYGLPSSF